MLYSTKNLALLLLTWSELYTNKDFLSRWVRLQIEILQRSFHGFYLTGY